MRRLLARLVVTTIALFAAVVLVPDITLDGQEWNNLSTATLPSLQAIINLVLVAAILTLVNAIVRPILKGLTCAITFFTLGLFIFVINALMLLLTAAISTQFDLGFEVNGFVAALLGSLVVSVVSLVLSIFIHDKHD